MAAGANFIADVVGHACGNTGYAIQVVPADQPDGAQPVPCSSDAARPPDQFLLGRVDGP